MKNSTIKLPIYNAMALPYITLEVIVAFFAIFGNLLVLIAFLVERKLRKTTNFYIVSLSVADLLIGLIGIPSAILVKIGLPVNAFTSCLVMLSTLIVLCTVSIFNLLAVSLDRYWAILYPFKYHTKMSRRAVVAIIFLCWMLGSIIGFLPLLGWNKGPTESGKCLFIPIIDYNFLVFMYFGTTIYPGVLMAYFYSRIYCVVIEQMRKSSNCNILSRSFKNPVVNHQININSMTNIKKKNCKSSLFNLNRKEVTKTKDLSVIVLLFMLCWMPLNTANCILAFCKTCNIPLQLMEFFIVLSHANSAINPFLYAYQMKDFRRTIHCLIRCRKLEEIKRPLSIITTTEIITVR